MTASPGATAVVAVILAAVPWVYVRREHVAAEGARWHR